MQEQTSNNKRIAKNTLFLYARMFFSMGITLFTSRVILQTLGIEDYGTYSVVGGVVAMFSFLNGGMISATQRYLTMEIAKNNNKQLQNIFSTALQIHALVALIIVIVAETVGLWFLYEKLVIPEGRMYASLWIYQCSIIACVINVISIPYNALIIAHEKMSAFAYISIYEVVFKLLIVYALYLLPWDKLIVYSALTLLVQLSVRFIYSKYCNKHFAESHYHHSIDTKLLKEMSSFAGWSFTTSIAYILSSHGVNILLNLFFGTAVNAARAIALQVQGALKQFTGSIQVAINPQITKNYASGQLDEMYVLMSRCARFSYYLLFIMSLPFLLRIEYILSVWLTEVPPSTVVFTRLIIVLTLLYPFSNPLIIANQATGNVKIYEFASGIILLLLIPISYLLLKLGAPDYSIFIVHIILELLTFVVRIVLIQHQINFSIYCYMKNTVFPTLVVTLISLIIPLIISFNTNEDLTGFLYVTCASIISSVITTLLFGVTKNERVFIFKKIIERLRI